MQYQRVVRGDGWVEKASSIALGVLPNHSESRCVLPFQVLFLFRPIQTQNCFAALIEGTLRLLAPHHATGEMACSQAHAEIQLAAITAPPQASEGQSRPLHLAGDPCTAWMQVIAPTNFFLEIPLS